MLRLGPKLLGALLALTLIPSPAFAVDFIRGDFNADGSVDIADVVQGLNYLIGDVDSMCLDAGDLNDDGSLSIADPIYLTYVLFSPSGPTLIGGGTCGPDLTSDALDCVDFPLCP